MQAIDSGETKITSRAAATGRTCHALWKMYGDLFQTTSFPASFINGCPLTVSGV